MHDENEAGVRSHVRETVGPCRLEAEHVVCCVSAQVTYKITPDVYHEVCVQLKVKSFDLEVFQVLTLKHIL